MGFKEFQVIRKKNQRMSYFLIWFKHLKSKIMKRIHLILIAAILATGMLSCKSTMYRLLGFKQPGVETPASINKFLLDIRQDTFNVCCFDTSLMEKYRHLPFKPGWTPAFRPIQIRVYDNSGSPVMQWVSCEGPLSEVKPFDSVPPRNIGELNTSLTLRQDIDQYFRLDGTKTAITPEPGYDYYILVYFAKWYPKLSKQSFMAVEKYRKKHPELKIKVYKVTTDIMEFWGVTPELELE
jgi:hypothetical protein